MQTAESSRMQLSDDSLHHLQLADTVRQKQHEKCAAMFAACIIVQAL